MKKLFILVAILGVNQLTLASEVERELMFEKVADVRLYKERLYQRWQQELERYCAIPETREILEAHGLTLDEYKKHLHQQYDKEREEFLYSGKNFASLYDLKEELIIIYFCSDWYFLEGSYPVQDSKKQEQIDKALEEFFSTRRGQSFVTIASPHDVRECELWHKRGFTLHAEWTDALKQDYLSQGTKMDDYNAATTVVYVRYIS